MPPLRRLLAALLMTAPMLLLAAQPGSAAVCSQDIDSPWIDPPPVYYPCPEPQDQLVPVPVWVTTDTGPGHDFATWDWIKVAKGSRIFFANVSPLEVPTGAGPERFHGPGFDSGVVPYGGAVEVQGISQLAVGWYPIRDVNNVHRGDLFIEPSYRETVQDGIDEIDVHLCDVICPTTAS